MFATGLKYPLSPQQHQQVDVFVGFFVVLLITVLGFQLYDTGLTIKRAYNKKYD